MSGAGGGAHRTEPSPAEAPVVTGGLPVASAEAMRDLGTRLAGLLRAGDLVILTGDLGAGKTTLTRGIGAGMDIRGDVTSPTFVIARAHPSLGEGPGLVHVDAYRLETLAEVDDLDLDTSLAESVTVVEWGEGMVEGLATDRLQIRLERDVGQAGPDDPEHELDEPRLVRFSGFGPRWDGVEFPGPADDSGPAGD